MSGGFCRIITGGNIFFHSQSIQEHPPVYVEFDKIFRQSDNLFIDLLNQVRNDSLSPEGFNLLQSRYDPHFNPSPDENYITLTTHNFSADAINSAELEKKSKQPFTNSKLLLKVNSL